MEQYEYRVCQAQQSRVTFVNGQWAGEISRDDADAPTALNSCPEVWDYLDQAGGEGWALVAVTTRIEAAEQVVDLLYLRKRC
ncbi:MAG: hypothetical protein M8467_01025 [Anaerolineae bacterium]|nr:hypothetical protein [Anaerolineae bacterium]